MEQITKNPGRKKLTATFAKLKATVIKIGKVPNWNKSDLLSYLNQYTTSRYYTDHIIPNEQAMIDRLMDHYELDNFQVLKLLPIIRQRKAEYDELNARNKFFKPNVCGHCNHAEEAQTWDVDSYKTWKEDCYDSIKKAINNGDITVNDIHKILDEWKDAEWKEDNA